MKSDYTSPPAAQAAAERVTYDLHYGRMEGARRIGPGYIDGPPIADAWDADELASGAWDHGGFTPENPDSYATPDDKRVENVSEADWIRHYADMILNEVLHEGLEWFQVDGRPWLNPHGRGEREIFAATHRFIEELADIRKRVDGADSHR